MLELLIAMGLFALVGAITPGPVNILAIRRSASGHGRAATAYVLGASLSYTLVVWLMGKGGEQVLHNTWVVETIRWAGAAYLLHLAWRIAMACPSALADGADAAAPSVARAFIDGGVVQTSNPKAWMVASAGVGLFVLPQPDVAAALRLFCAVSLLACCMGVGCWAVAGRLLSQWLASAARQRLFYRAMGVLLACSVVHMLR